MFEMPKILANKANRASAKRRALVMSGALFAAALTGCSISEDVKTESFVVGVECSDPEATLAVIDVKDIDNPNAYHGGPAKDIGASVDLKCSGDSTIESLVLLEGEVGTTINSNVTHAARVTYEYQQGGGWDGAGDMDPTVDLTNRAHKPEITINDVRSIRSVDVGTPADFKESDK